VSESDPLYIHADEKIDKIHAELVEVLRKIDALDQEQKRIAERIDKGVSQTAFKAFEMVNTLMAKVTEMAGTDQVQENRIKTLEKHSDWTIKGFIVVVAAGIVLAWLKGKIF
jgi:predicted RecB family endonuclease